MPPIIVPAKHRRPVRFPSSTTIQPPLLATNTSSTSFNKHCREARSASRKIMASTSQEPRPGIPVLFTQPPPIRDPLVTETLDLQIETVDKCLPFLQGVHTTQRGPFNALGVPVLQRDEHVAYLYDSLEDYPADFVAMDASRPWMVYWALAGLSLLGEDVTRFRQR